jgi:hypothetical protein
VKDRDGVVDRKHKSLNRGDRRGDSDSRDVRSRYEEEHVGRRGQRSERDGAERPRQAAGGSYHMQVETDVHYAVESTSTGSGSGLGSTGQSSSSRHNSRPVMDSTDPSELDGGVGWPGRSIVHDPSVPVRTARSLSRSLPLHFLDLFIMRSGIEFPLLRSGMTIDQSIQHGGAPVLQKNPSTQSISETSHQGKGWKSSTLPNSISMAHLPIDSPQPSHNRRLSWTDSHRTTLVSCGTLSTQPRAFLLF